MAEDRGATNRRLVKIPVGVRALTLLIVGGRDEVVIELNEPARRELRAPHRLEIVPGASHLFEEPGALEEVSRLARLVPQVSRARERGRADGGRGCRAAGTQAASVQGRA